MGKYNGVQTFDALIDLEDGKRGTDVRNKYEARVQLFIVREMSNDAKKKAKMKSKR